MPTVTFTRTRLHRTALVALLLALPTVAQAQADSAAPRRWELRIPSGTFMPTGAQRQQLARGSFTALQLAWFPRPALAVNGTVGWARSRDLAAAESPRVNAYAADLGVEARPDRWAVGHRVSFNPFVGVGAGLRSYDYRSRDADARHNVAGYAAMGGELGVGRVALRVEARQYVGGFAAMDGAGPTTTRSDVLVMAGLRFNRRVAARR